MITDGPRDRGVRPLVGRREELAFIKAALEESRGVLVIGPAGVGKTHLVGSVADELESQADVITISGAQSASSVPLAPLLSIIELGENRDLASSVLAELARRAKHSRVVLVVDDCHLLDQASAGLIHHAASSETAVLMLAARSGEPTAPAIESMWKDGLVGRLDLQPMDRASSDALARLFLAEPPPAVLNWLWERARGHPLFIRELARAMMDSGTNGSGFRPGELFVHPDVPPRLSELIDAHLKRLDPSDRLGLAAVAMAHPISHAAFDRVSSQRVRTRLVRRSLIRDMPAGLVVAHPLYVEAVIHQLPGNEADELRRLLAASLSQESGNEIRVAELLLDGGGVPPVSLLEQACDQTLALLRPDLAMKLAGALVRLDPTAAHLARLGAAHAMNKDWDRADPIFERATEGVAPEEAGAVWLNWLTATFENRNDPGRARDIAARAMQVLDGTDRQMAKAMWLRSRMFVEPLEPVFDGLSGMLADPDLPSEALALVAVDVATSSWHLCRPHDGLAAAELPEIPERNPVDVIRARQVAANLRVWGVGIGAAHQAVDELAETGATRGDPYAGLMSKVARLLVVARAGQAAQVSDHWNELERIARTTPDLRWFPLTCSEACIALAALVEGEDRCRQLIDQLETWPAGALYSTLTQLCIAKSRLWVREGDEGRALEALDQGLEYARERNAYVYEMLCLRERTLVWPTDRGTVERSEQIASRAGPGLASIMAREARAIYEEEAGELHAVARTAEAYGATGLAWEAAGAAHLLFVAGGDEISALACELRVERLGELHPGQISVAVENMEPILTPSQRRVAAMSATGATNAETAERLFLSPRTVKRHLEDIYKRLGISGRQDLEVIYEHSTSID